MLKIELSKRLSNVAEFTKKGEPILDVGSDHAYLPIYLIQNNLVSKAIAGEVVAGPFKHAQQTVSSYTLEDKIDVRLGDGLNVLHEKETVGTIFICGMGGLLISEILKDGKKHNKLPINARLVLQPNSAESKLREYLIQERYEIIEEAIVKENNKYYEIIVAEFVDKEVTYSEEEIFFGPKLFRTRTPIFIEKWQAELAKNQTVYQQVQKSNNEEKIEEFEKIIKRIKRVIQ